MRLLVPYGRSNVTAIALIRFFSNFYIYLPIAPLYLRGNGLSFLQINSLWGIIVGVMMVSEVPTGVLADRIGRKWSVCASLAFQLAGELIFLCGSNYTAFVISAVVAGIGFAFASGATDALVYDTLARDGRDGEMTEAIGYVNAAARLANLIAFGLGGLLAVGLTQPQFQAAIAVTAGAVAVALVVSFLLHEPDAVTEEKSAESPSTLRAFAAGFQALRGNRALRALFLLYICTLPYGDYLLNLYPAYFVQHGVPDVWLGFALAIGSGLGIFSARYAYRLETKLGPAQSLLLVTLLPGLFYLLLAALFTPGLIVFVFCVLVGGMSLREPIFSNRFNHQIDSDVRATTLSTISMAQGGIDMLMGLVIGVIADVSIGVTFAFVGAIVVAAALLLRVPVADLSTTGQRSG